MPYLNTMLLSMLEAVGISQDGVVEQLIVVSSFGCSARFILDYIDVDLTIGPIRAAITSTS